MSNSECRNHAKPPSSPRDRHPLFRYSSFDIRYSLILLLFLILPFSLSLSTSSCFAADPAPLLRAHAHNDYEHARPLLDALDRGFCSVEADIFLVDGKLLVAHERRDIKPERTLQALYLDPLLERVRKYGGRVHPAAAEFWLLIDIKTEAAATYAALREALMPYAEMLTEFGAAETRKRAVTAYVSGNRPREAIFAESPRLAAMDGRLEDLEGATTPEQIPVMSDNWTRLFKWKGEGAMPEGEKTKLRDIVEKAHKQDRKVRFWAAPDRKEAWAALLDAGVDFINTDDLDGLRDFLRAAKKD